MTMLKKFLAVIISGLLITSSGNAMQLSLAESIERALSTDENISAAQFGRDSAKWNLSAARRQSGLNFSWDSQAYKIGGRSYNAYREAHKRYGNNGSIVYDEYGFPARMSGSTAYNNTFSNTFGITFPIYTGGQIEGNIKNRRYALNSADLTVENTRQTVKYRVIQAYYNVLQQKNLVEVNESAARMVSEQLNVLQVQYEEGATAYAEVLQMKVQLANYNQNLTTSRSDLAVAKSTLLSLTELPEDTPLELTDEFSYKPYELSLEECLAYGFKNRPDLAAANYNVNQAEAAVKSAKSGNRPSLTGRATKSIEANGAFRSERSETWQAGVVLSWNVFDNYVTSANVHAAKSEVERLKAQAELINKNVDLEIRTAYDQMRAAEENIKLTQARTNYFTSLYRYNLYKAQLEKAMGIPVAIDVPKYIAAEHAGKSADKALILSTLDDQ